MVIKVGIYGSSGRMGKAISSIISTNEDSSLKLAYQYCYKNDIVSVEEMFSVCDVIIDVSRPKGTVKLLELVDSTQHNIKLVICTTGLIKTDFSLIEKAAKNIPILYAENTSIGAFCLNKTSYVLSDILFNKANINADVDILDIHHENKKDAPSGTALRISRSIKDASEQNTTLQDAVNIKVSSIRSGDHIGEHMVTFSMVNESIKIIHKIDSRQVFAQGAIKCAKWIYNQDTSGRLYTINDIL